MNETKVHEGILSNKIGYEIHIAETFSGKSEIAIKIDGEIASILTVSKKRSGNIACIPSQLGSFLIKKSPETENLAEPPPSLDDVLEPDSDLPAEES
jgi:hypothetical protein